MSIVSDFNAKIELLLSERDITLSRLVFDETQPSLIQYAAWTGLGKTGEAIQIIFEKLTEPKLFPENIIYTSNRILEVLEVTLRLHAKLVDSKSRNANYFINKIFIKLTKEESKEACKIVLNSPNWSREQKKFLKRLVDVNTDLICSKIDTKAKLVKLLTAKTIITTHASLPKIKTVTGFNSSQYIWICDELLYHHFSEDGLIIEGDEDSFKTLAQVSGKANTSSKVFQPTISMGRLFEANLLTSTNKNGVRFVHLNRDNGFKRTIVMSASKSKSNALNLLKGEEYIKIMSPKKNISLKEIGLNCISSINGIPVEDLNIHGFDIENLDLGKLFASIQTVDTSSLQEDVLVVGPKSKHIGVGVEIKLDLTGTNSYSDFTKVCVRSSFSYPHSMESNFKLALGDDAESVLTMMKVEMLMQSFYRCSIRKGGKFDLIIGSLEAFSLVMQGFLDGV
jgi:hypothetical protein